MPCPNKNRKRSSYVNFRVTPEERIRIEERMKVLGTSKSDYYIKTFLGQEIKIVVGKYQSDRLSLEFKRLREAINSLNENNLGDDLELLLQETKALLIELKPLVEERKKDELSKEDFEKK